MVKHRQVNEKSTISRHELTDSSSREYSDNQSPRVQETVLQQPATEELCQSDKIKATPSILDSKTKRFLVDRADSIGLLTRLWDPASIAVTFERENIEIQTVTTYETRGMIVTVYRYPSSIDQPSSAIPDNPGEHQEYQYAAEWPISIREGDRGFATYIFNHLPEKEEIRTAEIIHRLTYGFWFGNLKQTFECKHCSETSHWLAISAPTSRQNPLTIRDRFVMTSNCNCGCLPPQESPCR